MYITRKAIRTCYRHILKPILFKIDPEKIHDWFTIIGSYLGRYTLAKRTVKTLFHYHHPSLQQNVAKINFKNPIGLAAGFDKDGYMSPIMSAVGFGYTIVGSVTANAYPGNPKPRLHRLHNSRSIIVNYGLKNEGVLAISQRLKKNHLSPIPVGISIAKTNCQQTANPDTGIKDYAATLEHLSQNKLGSFYEINISCPNAFGGEPFTTPNLLESLLTKLDKIPHHKPVFIKMPISTSWPEFKSLLDVIIRHKVAGIVIGNLNKNLHDPILQEKIPTGTKGGLSGRPTQTLSNKLISKTYLKYGHQLTIIGCGGIFSAEDAYEKIRLGASLLQLITGMIFEGPQLIGDINQGLVKLLEQDGFSSVNKAMGSYHHQKNSAVAK